MGYAENFIQAFQLGTQIRQRQEQFQQQQEQFKLEKEIHQQRIRQMGIDEKLAKRKLDQETWEMLSGQPKSSYEQPTETSNLGGFPRNAIPGGAPISDLLTDPWGDTVAGYEGAQTPSVNPADMEMRRFQRPSVNIGGVPELGVQGISRPVETLEEQLLKMRAKAMAGSTAVQRYQSVAGQLPNGTDAFGVFNDMDGTYVDPISRQPIAGFMPRTTTPSAGVDVERAVQMAGFQRFADVPDDKKAAVYELAQGMAKSFSYNRGMGTGDARLDAPITPTVSQQTGLEVGQPGSAYSGQTVPTAEDRQAGRTGQILLGDLKRLTGDGQNPGLLDVLPREADSIGGILPGAVMRYKRISERPRVAALESVVQGMVNDLARYKGQRGAQTEGDVERAYQQLLTLKTNLTDSFLGEGDTYESALERIKQAEAGLKIVASYIPPKPVPNAGAKSSAAATTPAVPMKFVFDPKTKQWVLPPTK